MQLVIMALADYANVTVDKKLNIMGIFSIIFASSFPARHPSLYLVIQLSPELGELDQNKALMVKLVDSDHSELNSFSVPFKIEKDHEGNRPDTNVILQLTDIVFPSTGTYNFVAELDGDFLGSVT